MQGEGSNPRNSANRSEIKCIIPVNNRLLVCFTRIGVNLNNSRRGYPRFRPSFPISIIEGMDQLHPQNSRKGNNSLFPRSG